MLVAFTNKWKIECDDPFARDCPMACVSETPGTLGQLKVIKYALQNGWSEDPETKKWTCLECRDHFANNSEVKIRPQTKGE